MQVTCPCGTRFEAQSPRATYCSAACRKRGSRAGIRVDRPVRSVPAAPPVPDEADIPSVTGAVIADLSEANAMKSPAGLAAVRLAQLIDAASPAMAGTAVAAWTKEMRASLAEAKRAAPAQEEDPIDDLERRRAARRHA